MRRTFRYVLAPVCGDLSAALLLIPFQVLSQEGEGALIPYLLIRQANRPPFYVSIRPEVSQKTSLDKPWPGVLAILKDPAYPDRLILVQGVGPASNVRVRAWVAEGLDRFPDKEKCPAIQEGKVPLRLFFNEKGGIGRTWEVSPPGHKEPLFSVALTKGPAVPWKSASLDIVPPAHGQGLNCCSCGGLLCCPNPGQCLGCGDCGLCCLIPVY